MLDIFDMAKYMLQSVGGEVSTMFLRELCYYSQAWHLVWTNAPMFPENFERRDNGSVCEELLNVHCGVLRISENDIEEKYLNG
jgi:uncharacterized phage-associated protein